MGCNCEKCKNKNNNQAYNNQNQYGNVQQYPNGCGLPEVPKGTSQRYESYRDVDGQVAEIRNDNYYDNFYTRYNHYYVKDYNHITDYYRDVNVYHYCEEVVYEGCKYQGYTSKIYNGCEYHKKDDNCKPIKKCGC